MSAALQRHTSAGTTTMRPVTLHGSSNKRTLTEIDASIGRRLRSLRKERGMSMAQLGDALDLTYQQIQKYEKGVNRLSGDRLVRAAAALEVPVSALISDTERQAEQSLGDKLTATSKGCRLAAAFLAIDAHAGGRDMLVNLAEWLLLMQQRAATQEPL
jgi:transcriptional regulator with XRE-family HTH domain